MGSFSGKKLLVLGFIVVLLIAIPLTVFILQKQQETRSHAEAATKLSFCQTTDTACNQTSQSSPIQVKVGDTMPLDVFVDPGTNFVTHVKLVIKYDQKIFAKLDSGGFTKAQNSPLDLISGPSYTTGSDGLGLISIVLSSSGQSTKTLQSPTRVGKLLLKVIAPTTDPSIISFSANSVVISGKGASDTADVNTNPNATDQYNVLSSTSPVYIAATGTTQTTTPSPTGSSSSATNQPPVCSTLVTDRAQTGSAPFSLTFTATGSDPDGTIVKATFNFGDGPVQDIISSGGIGTKSVSVQVAHTYQSAGTFSASAILTDDKGAVSSGATCSQTITVTASVGGTSNSSSGGTAGSSVPTPIPYNNQTAQAKPTPVLKPGPSNAIVGVGAAGVLVTVIGAILFFLL